MKHLRTLRVAGGVAALAALTAVGATGGAAAQAPAKADATVISMERDGKKLFFNAPPTVEAGTTLKIKNKTNPRAVGPHTFSLVKPKFLPEGNKEIKACSRKLAAICGAVAFKWHRIDPETFEVTENPVVVGKDGWDKQGSLKQKGDSWISDRKKQAFKREVSAPAGKTLTFLCVVHAEMQGQITVTE